MLSRHFYVNLCKSTAFCWCIEVAIEFFAAFTVASKSQRCVNFSNLYGSSFTMQHWRKDYIIISHLWPKDELHYYREITSILSRGNQRRRTFSIVKYEKKKSGGKDGAVARNLSHVNDYRPSYFYNFSTLRHSLLDTLRVRDCLLELAPRLIKHLIFSSDFLSILELLISKYRILCRFHWHRHKGLLSRLSSLETLKSSSLDD